MNQVGVFEGKTHFSALIDEAEHSETIVVTRNGKPVARVVPVEPPTPREFGSDDGLGYLADDFDAPLPADSLKRFTG